MTRGRQRTGLTAIAMSPVRQPTGGGKTYMLLIGPQKTYVFASCADLWPLMA